MAIHLECTKWYSPGSQTSTEPATCVLLLPDRERGAGNITLSRLSQVIYCDENELRKATDWIRFGPRRTGSGLGETHTVLQEARNTTSWPLGGGRPIRINFEGEEGLTCTRPDQRDEVTETDSPRTSWSDGDSWEWFHKATSLPETTNSAHCESLPVNWIDWEGKIIDQKPDIP